MCVCMCVMCVDHFTKNPNIPSSVEEVFAASASTFSYSSTYFYLQCCVKAQLLVNFAKAKHVSAMFIYGTRNE